MEQLGKLNVYRYALGLSDKGWHIYQQLPKEMRFEMGSQFLRAVDSIGANIAEGYGRFHYKDKVKFYYNARGSLWEVKHWLWLLHRRQLIAEPLYTTMMDEVTVTGKMLNAFIASTGKTNDQ